MSGGPVDDFLDGGVFILNQVSNNFRFTCIQRGAPGKLVVHFTITVIAVYLLKSHVNWFGWRVYGIVTEKITDYVSLHFQQRLTTYRCQTEKQ